MNLPLRKLQCLLAPLTKTVKYRILGYKIDRNQWNLSESSLWETYKSLMCKSWEEIKTEAPQYFQRLQFSVSKARGRVLEIGCGIGNMTRWLSESPEVDEIVAVDAFSEAIDELIRYNLPKVTPLQMKLEHLRLDVQYTFDTVMVCEVIEHLYQDEEISFLNSLRPYINSKTRFVVSVPIGWLDDPYHVRCFSRRGFKKHLNKFYGNPIEIDYSSGYSQVAWGHFNCDSNRVEGRR